MGPVEFMFFADQLVRLRSEAMLAGFTKPHTSLREFVGQIQDAAIQHGAILDRFDDQIIKRQRSQLIRILE